jgi:DNA polymerase-3 subunit alpha
MWAPLHAHSHYSLLDGLSKPTQMAERCVKLGYEACALSDHGSVSGSISFVKACQSVCACSHQKAIHDSGKRCQMKGCNCEAYNRYSLKPILGCEFYLSGQCPTIKDGSNRKLSHLVVLAKNKQGWYSLVQAVSAANRPEHVYYKKPRLKLEQLAAFSKGNFIAFSGHPGSDLANVMFTDLKGAYNAQTYEEARSYVRSDWKEAILKLAGHYQELFGKGNFWLESQRIDQHHIPAADVVARTLAWVSKKLDIPIVATPDAHYPTRQDAVDQRIELCSQFKTTLSAVQGQIARNEDATLAAFFKSNSYHIPSVDEIAALHTAQEMQGALDIAEQCEFYDVLRNPIMPVYDCPQGAKPDDYLTELCKMGWQKKVSGKVPNARLQEYKDRLDYELGVIKGASLSSYFLIVQDYVRYAKDVLRCLVGPGRGSGAGCLVSHLVNITDIDPIEHGLIFERFYNAGRNTKDRISMPDIDSDFPKFKREKVVKYVEGKYLPEHVAHMVTFGRMQGKAALKEVFRINGKLTHDERNEMCKYIPSDAAISDDLQEMREEEGEASIIKWALRYEAKGLSPWCTLKEDGTTEGEFSTLFDQAIRLEGTKKSQGKHASGIVISPVVLSEVCPMIYDSKTNSVVAGFEMNDMEAIGITKFDILGLSLLDKLEGTSQLLEFGKIMS